MKERLAAGRPAVPGGTVAPDGTGPEKTGTGASRDGRPRGGGDSRPRRVLLGAASALLGPLVWVLLAHSGIDDFPGPLEVAGRTGEMIGEGTLLDDTGTAEQPMTSVTPGASVTSAIGTTVTKGGPQAVRLSATGLPEGTTATFEPARVQSGAGSRLTLRTSPSTPLGDYTVKVVAAGVEATHSAQITLSVTGGSASR
ncbi:COG1470 family protein [Streptomyces prasinus]|uniref:COG1470 family protein n=1 Tax=Streptomyces prasinus TaxID=67345 RepID=UPI00368F7DB8